MMVCLGLKVVYLIDLYRYWFATLITFGLVIFYALFSALLTARWNQDYPFSNMSYTLGVLLGILTIFTNVGYMILILNTNPGNDSSYQIWSPIVEHITFTFGFVCFAFVLKARKLLDMSEKL